MSEPLTDERAAQEMRELRELADKEGAHMAGDELVFRLLMQAGYTQTATAYQTARSGWWYS